MTAIKGDEGSHSGKMFSLEDKVAVITGAASGFDKTTSMRFARAGARVVMADISDAGEIVEEIGGVYVRISEGGSTVNVSSYAGYTGTPTYGT